MRNRPVKIRNVLMRFFIIYVVFAFVLVIGVSNWLFKIILNEHILNQMLENTEIAKTEVLSYIMEVETQISALTIRPEVFELVHTLNTIQSSHYNGENIASREALAQAVNYRIGMFAFGVYGKEMKTSMYMGRIWWRNLYSAMPLDPDMSALQDSDRVLLWGPPFDWQYGNSRMFCVQSLIANPKTMEIIGATTAILESRNLNMILKRLNRTTNNSFYLTHHGKIVATSGQDSEDVLQVPKDLVSVWNDKSNNIYAGKTSNGSLRTCTLLPNGWHLVAVMPAEKVFSKLESLNLIIWVVCITACLFALVASIFLSKRITHPIGLLAKHAQRIAKGSTVLSIPVDNRFEEIAALGDSINNMLQGINELVIKVYEQQIYERDARIKLLQAQINPHFLYNTLDLINASLINNSEYTISTMVTSLADILRYSINDGDMIVPLQEELDYLYKYLYIQNIKFAKRLSYEIKADRQVHRAQVLKFIIQPLVENAIKHGFSHVNQQLHVIINAQKIEEFLVILVSDNGTGMKAETIQQIYNLTNVPGSSSGVHLGLCNIIQRIKLMYGEENGSVIINSQPGQGTSVEIRFPFELFKPKIEEE